MFLRFAVAEGAHVHLQSIANARSPEFPWSDCSCVPTDKSSDSLTLLTHKTGLVEAADVALLTLCKFHAGHN